MSADEWGHVDSTSGLVYCVHAVDRREVPVCASWLCEAHCYVLGGKLKLLGLNLVSQNDLGCCPLASLKRGGVVCCLLQGAMLAVRQNAFGVPTSMPQVTCNIPCKLAVT